MTYSVQNTDGSKTINVAASQVNSSFSVALVGRNVSGYGQYFVQNSIRHLENFASTSAPSDSVLLNLVFNFLFVDTSKLFLCRLGN